MTEVLFYHMTESKLENTLPDLLGKSLDKGWNCVVQSGDQDILKEIDGHLWTYKPNSFLAHSMQEDGHEKDQPIWLTCGDENPNNAQIRFLVSKASPPELSNYERAVYLFDGHNEEAVSHARERWKLEKENGHTVTYWQQKADKSWGKKS